MRGHKQPQSEGMVSWMVDMRGTYGAPRYRHLKHEHLNAQLIREERHEGTMVAIVKKKCLQIQT